MCMHAYVDYAVPHTRCLEEIATEHEAKVEGNNTYGEQTWRQHSKHNSFAN